MYHRVFLILALLLVPSLARPSTALKPYRVLLVASVQMRDDYVIHDAWDFGAIASLLKLWGVPFNVMRLDTHRMKDTDFADSAGHAKYGTIIWTARSQAECLWSRQDYGVLTSAVRDHHVSIIAVGNKMQDRAVQQLLGLEYRGFPTITQPVSISRTPHFITRDAASSPIPSSEVFAEGGPEVSLSARDVLVLARSGTLPQLTVRTLDQQHLVRAVWIGGDPDHVFLNSPSFIQILKRALVWTQGCLLYKDYGKSVVFRMDDPGSSQSAYFKGWDYPQLDQDAIEKSILAPLRAHHAVLGVAFCPGYPWIPKRSLVHSVTLDFVDPRGVRQNIVSQYAGLKAGMNEGLLDVESHGLTHMPPDLESAPEDGVSWWDGNVTREWPDEGWYREFYDQRRAREVEASQQLAHLKQSAEWIEQDFQRRPLVFIPPGHALSGDRFSEGKTVGGRYVPPHIALNYTYRLAALAGYGLALDLSAAYLGPDRVVALDTCTAQAPEANFRRGAPAVVYFHDRDIREDPDYLSKMLDRFGKGVRYLGLDEWTAYLHCRNRVALLDDGSVRIEIDRGDRCCRYFGEHESVWTLHLSDESLSYAKLRGHRLKERQEITAPPGNGSYTLSL